MNKRVERKIERIKRRIADGTNVSRDILELALSVLPDSYHDDDESWNWCWEELSTNAQDYVKEIRSLINLYLKETFDNG